MKTSLVTGGTTRQVTQVTYDNANRVTCTAQRMNPLVFASLPTSACQLGTASNAYGFDRITVLTYDDADRVLKTTTGYGTADQRDDAASTYGLDGEVLTQTDAKGDLTTYEYDGLDRLTKIRFPTPSNGAVSSTTDYEQYTYDNNGDVTADRRRDGQTISYTFDALNLMTSGANGATYAYDNMGRLTHVSGSSSSIDYTYDALSRRLTESTPYGAVTSQYDAAGRRTHLQWPQGSGVTYGYDATSAMISISDGSGALAAYTYDDLGRRGAITRGDSVTTTYGYDPSLQLSSLAHAFPDSSKNQTYAFAYNPASQLTTSSASNPLYDWAAGYNVVRNYTADGLNRYMTSGSLTLGYDGRSNLGSDSQTTYGYDVTNKLTSLSNGAALAYDPAERLFQTSASSAVTRFVYDGGQIIAEYDASDTLLRRYVPGPSVDEPVVWYEGSGVANRRWLVADRMGSVIAVADASGSTVAINTYDEHGIPGSGNIGRFQYDGAPWIPEVGLYHMRARAYSPTLGRFMQTDPIGYGDGLNMYAYVHGDPVNSADPSGMRQCSASESPSTGSRLCGVDTGASCSGDCRRFGYIGGIYPGYEADQEKIAGSGSSHGYAPSLTSPTASTADTCAECVAEVIVTAYNGRYHDEVVADLVSGLIRQHILAFAEVPICLYAGGPCARADIVYRDRRNGMLTVVEVKTGDRPGPTIGQTVVYPHLRTGGLAYSVDSRLFYLGYVPGQPLPPIQFVGFYQKDPFSSEEIYVGRAR